MIQQVAKQVPALSGLSATDLRIEIIQALDFLANTLAWIPGLPRVKQAIIFVRTAIQNDKVWAVIEAALGLLGKSAVAIMGLIFLAAPAMAQCPGGRCGVVQYYPQQVQYVQYHQVQMPAPVFLPTTQVVAASPAPAPAATYPVTAAFTYQGVTTVQSPDGARRHVLTNGPFGSQVVIYGPVSSGWLPFQPGVRYSISASPAPAGAILQPVQVVPASMASADK